MRTRKYNVQPDDFKNIPFERNPNFAADTSGEIICEAKEVWTSNKSLYDLFDVKEDRKIYYVYEGKDGELKAYAWEDGKFTVEVNNEH